MARMSFEEAQEKLQATFNEVERIRNLRAQCEAELEKLAAQVNYLSGMVDALRPDETDEATEPVELTVVPDSEE